MSILQTVDLKKHYRQGDNVTKALDGVSLAIEEGEFVAIVGTSGSGKSTLLHMMGGLDFHLSLKDMGTALGVILFFMLDGFLMIYNINTIYVTKDIQFYGLLKTIGTAPGQLKRLMYYRMRNILLSALPVGLVLGGVMTPWIVPMILGGILEGFEAARFHLIIPFTMSVSILGRARESATMEAVGASRKQMKKLIT